MCFHYALSAEAQKLKNRYKAEYINDASPVYHANGFSFPKMPIISNEQPDQIQQYGWGLIPSWIKDKSSADDIRKNTLNARSETIFEKPSFKNSIIRKRCLIPATGFFEWRHIGTKKIPYFINSIESEIMSFGGIWSQWKDNEMGVVYSSYSIITTEANKLMTFIHNKKKRMPLIIPKSNEYIWLDNNIDKQTIIDLMKPLDEGLLQAITIDSKISSTKLNSNIPEITEVFEYEGIDTKIS